MTLSLSVVQDNITSCVGLNVAPEGKACSVDIAPIKKLCDQNGTYGYADGSPCIFLQLNYHLLSNYTPQVYSPEELISTPDLPDALRYVPYLRPPQPIISLPLRPSPAACHAHAFRSHTLSLFFSLDSQSLARDNLF